MATFTLIPGAGGMSWYWHLVRPRLEAAGHQVVTPDMPARNPSARLGDYVQTVIDAIGAHGIRGELVIVGQSLGGLVAPVVAKSAGASKLVLVAAMIPAPGESGGQWWAATGQPEAAARAARAEGRDPAGLDDPVETFLHDLPNDVLAEALRRPIEQNDGPFKDPWPLDHWPSTPTTVVAGRFDRLFPLPFMQRLAQDRLGIDPDVIDSGHLPALAAPDSLTRLLLGYL